MTLWSMFHDHQGRLIHKWKHYFPAYEAHFNRFVNRPLILFEIGVSHGGSLQLWKKYFGPGAQIVGLDVDQRCAALVEDQISVRIGSQADPNFLQSVLDEFGSPDIIIDDGSHVMSDVIASFKHLYPKMSETGVYFVEDMHTSYWTDYEGGLRRKSTFIEMAKGLIDELNAEWTRGELIPTEFSKSTLSIHFYDSCVVFERGRTSEKFAPRFGSPSF